MKIAALSIAVLPFAAEAAFQASFDRDFTAETSAGPVQGRYSAEVLWENLATYLQPGVVETAALIGTGDTKDEDYHVTWNNAGYFSPEHGGVAFWVSPRDWDGDDAHFHVFFRAEGPDADLLLYKYPDGRLLFLMGPKRKAADGSDRRTNVSCSVTDWKRGDWHYVVATWGDGEMDLYVDGKLMGKSAVTAAPGSPFATFGAGGLRPLQWKTPQNRTLIDELLVEDRRMTPFDALSVYLEQRPAKKAANVEDPISPEDEAKMKAPETWRGNDIGKARDGEVPPPWSPVGWNEGVFACWNRTYNFGGGFLPRQIVAGGEKLFARPPTLKMDGLEVSTAAPRLVSKTAERATFTFSGKAGGFGVSVSAYAEFDGFVWYELELKPESAAATFGSLVMEFPFAKNASTLFNAMVKQYGAHAAGACGEFRDFEFDLFRDTSRTMFVGNDKVGLEWFCEEMTDWCVTKKESALRLVKGKESNSLVLAFADRPPPRAKSLKYRFGLQAQPVRPMAKDWRRLREVSYSLTEREFVRPPSIYSYFVWESLHNVPDADYPLPDLAARRAKAEAKSKTLCWYFAGFSTSPYAPAWRKHGPEWTQTPPAIGTIGSATSRQWAFVRVCPSGDGYVDYYLAGLEDAVKRLDMEGLYFDNQDPQFCDNALHGHGWRGQDGKRYKTYNLLATRELAQRIYRMFRRLKPNGHIMRHMSQKNISPVNGFADSLADGECYCSTVGLDESYLNVFDPASFRAQFRAAPYGIARYFIPQFQRAINLNGRGKQHYLETWAKSADLVKHRSVLRHFLGYIIVHDAQIWPRFGITGNEWYRIQDRFGFDGNERFIMYTDDESPFRYGGGRVMASVYSKPGGSILVAIMNDADVPLERLSFDRGRMAALAEGRELSFRDAETGRDVKIVGDAFAVSVAPRDFAVLENTPR